MNKDYIIIKNWAEEKSKEHMKDIKNFISQGIDKKTAAHMVLDRSTIGSGYKAQIVHDLGIFLY